jgi:hypothetical protein
MFSIITERNNIMNVLPKRLQATEIFLFSNTFDILAVNLMKASFQERAE